jgi:hypothetical protein
MGQAIAFVMILVVFSVFMPDVFRALSVFLLTLINKGTGVLDTLPNPQPAMVSQTLTN